MKLSKGCLQFCLVFLFCIAIVVSGANESLAAQKKMLTWGTSPAATSSFVYFTTAAKILNEKIPEINITVRATGAGVQNVNLLEKGEVDMGATDTGIAHEAYQGKGVFQGKPYRDLRLLFVGHAANPFNFVVTEKSGVKDVYGLEGKLFTPGPLGSGAEKNATDIFRILGVRPNIRQSSWADAMQAIQDGRIIGYSRFGAIPDAGVLETMSTTKIRLLSFSDGDIEKIVKNTIGLRKIAVPSGAYAGIDGFMTVTNEFSDFATKDLPADIAYKIIKVMLENGAEIKRALSSYSGDKLVEVTLGVKTEFVYLHPGVVKFCRDKGYVVPKNLIPPEMGEK
jgi:uncharacterized protein